MVYVNQTSPFCCLSEIFSCVYSAQQKCRSLQRQRASSDEKEKIKRKEINLCFCSSSSSSRRKVHFSSGGIRTTGGNNDDLNRGNGHVPGQVTIVFFLSSF